MKKLKPMIFKKSFFKRKVVVFSSKEISFFIMFINSKILHINIKYFKNKIFEFFF